MTPALTSASVSIAAKEQMFLSPVPISEPTALPRASVLVCGFIQAGGSQRELEPSGLQ